MEELAKLRHHTDTTATYDVVERDNLINTAKYAELRAAVLRHFDPKDKNNSYPNMLLLVVSDVLLCSKHVYDRWFEEGRLHLVEAIDEHHYSPKDDDADTLFKWMQKIDSYAAPNSFPTHRLMLHSAYGPVSHFQITRNLNRFMDAATLFAFWSLMSAYELLATGLLRRRLLKAIKERRREESDIGEFSILHFTCLEKIVEAT